MRCPFYLVAIILLLNVLPASADSLDKLCSAPSLSDLRPRTGEHANQLTCSYGPTTRIGILVNLDASQQGFSTIRPGASPSQLEEFRTTLAIRDQQGVAQNFMLFFYPMREPNRWYVELDFPTDAWRAPDRAEFITSIPFIQTDLEALGPKATIQFDEDGRLLPPTSVMLSIPSSEQDSEQAEPRRVEIDFVTAAGASTQYAAPFQVSAVENDGQVCPLRSPSTGVCYLDSRAHDPRWVSPERSVYLDIQGDLVTEDRKRIQGYLVDFRTAERDATPSNARVPRGLLPPRETQSVRMVLELRPSEPVTFPGADLSRFVPKFRVYFRYFDRLGSAQQGALLFYPIAENRWRWLPEYDSGGLRAILFQTTPNSLTSAVDAVGGELIFDRDGILASVTTRGALGAQGSGTLFLPALPFAALEFDFGVGETFLGDISRTLQISQNGYGAGTLTSVFLSPAGRASSEDRAAGQALGLRSERSDRRGPRPEAGYRGRSQFVQRQTRDAAQPRPRKAYNSVV